MKKIKGIPYKIVTEKEGQEIMCNAATLMSHMLRGYWEHEGKTLTYCGTLNGYAHFYEVDVDISNLLILEDMKDD